MNSTNGGYLQLVPTKKSAHVNGCSLPIGGGVGNEGKSSENILNVVFLTGPCIQGPGMNA